MKLIFYILFGFYVSASIIFSNFDLNFDKTNIFGIAISIILLGIIWILCRKFIKTENPIFVILVASIVIIRSLIIFIILGNDTHNAIKNEFLLYIASGILALWCVYCFARGRKHRSDA
jgi:hypothetical protein